MEIPPNPRERLWAEIDAELHGDFLDGAAVPQYIPLREVIADYWPRIVEWFDLEIIPEDQRISPFTLADVTEDMPAKARELVRQFGIGRAMARHAAMSGEAEDG